MRIGVPKETAEDERRVALVPEVVRKLSGGGHEVVVEAGAGEQALLPDALYTDAGATIGDPYCGDVVVRVAGRGGGGGGACGARRGRKKKERHPHPPRDPPFSPSPGPR